MPTYMGSGNLILDSAVSSGLFLPLAFEMGDAHRSGLHEILASLCAAEYCLCRFSHICSYMQ